MQFNVKMNYCAPKALLTVIKTACHRKSDQAHPLQICINLCVMTLISVFISTNKSGMFTVNVCIDMKTEFKIIKSCKYVRTMQRV